MLTNLIMVLVGLILLYVGGEGLLKGSLAVARRLHLSELFVSLVIIGFGTSTPEMMVSLSAAFKGSGSIALGNVIGSNIANILLVLGVAAFVRPLAMAEMVPKSELVICAIATVLTVVVVHLDILNLWVALGFYALLLLYLTMAWRSQRQQKKDPLADIHLSEQSGTSLKANSSDPQAIGNETNLKIGLYLLVGFVGLTLGASLLVDGSSDIARTFGVSESTIGLTLVALGTSLPELSTALIAAYRGQGAAIVGNVIGSNLFNILAILGTTTLISPFTVPQDFSPESLWVFGVSGLGLSFWLARYRTFSRMAALAMIGAYIVMSVYLYL